MKKLSQKDKKMAMILAVFLIAAAYYEFLLVPLTNMNNSSQKSLMAKRKELLIVKTKLGGLSNFKKKILDLKKVIYITRSNNKMPDIDNKLNYKMKAMMSAAKKASVKVLSLKPINSVGENDDGTVKIIKDKYISIEGSSDISSFLNFLKNLWGVELEEIELSSESKDGSRLRFYIKTSFFPKIDFAAKLAEGEHPTNIKFGVKHNIFAKIIPPPPPPPPKPPGWKPPLPPKPVYHLNNAKLLGVAEFGTEKMAIVEDGIKKETDFFFIGSKFRKSKLLKVDKQGAVFIFPEGGKVTLKLPNEKKYYSVAGSTGKTKQRGHLGILAETFTDQLAKQYGIPFKPGLLVISTGSHGELQKDDIIKSINGTPTPNFESALEVMKNIFTGGELHMVISRKGKIMGISYKAD